MSERNVSIVSPNLRCNTNNLRHRSSRNRSRSWCFTINNHDENLFVSLSRDFFWKREIVQIVFQEETGKNNTKHIQGFVKFKNQVDFSIIKSVIPTAHIEKCRSDAASIKYCSKEDTRTGRHYEFGIKRPQKEITDEEICLELKRLMHKDIDEDPDGFWESKMED